MKYLSALPPLFISLLVHAGAAQAQTPSFAWAKRAGATGQDFGRGIAVDGNGNSYITGSFEGSITFGSSALTSNGASDVFIAKYDAAGNALWAQKAGGTDFDAGFGIAVDNSGNSYITGQFRGSATFGSTTLTNSGNANVFIAKYDASGNALWAEKLGGTTNYFSRAIAVDASGNSYITGSFEGSVSSDFFIAKFDASGNLLWAQDAGGPEMDYGFGISVDGNGNSYVTGDFEGSVTFGSTTLTSSGNADIFIAKYDSSGSLLWAQKAGGTEFDFGFGIATDVSGNSYITGHFWGTATFGTTPLNSSGNYDVFIAKYDSAGNVLWVQKAGGAAGVSGRAIAIDGIGNSYITGFFEGTTSFGSTALTSSGTTDVFIAKYDASGNAIWAQKAGGINVDFGFGIAVDGSDNSYITGFFDGSATFGSTIFPSNGSRDLFFAKLSPVTGTPEETAGSLTLYPDPFTTSFQVALPALSTQPATAILTDLLGREVHRQVVQPHSSETTASVTPAAHLPSGVYVLQLRQGDQVRQVKVVKQ